MSSLTNIHVDQQSGWTEVHKKRNISSLEDIEQTVNDEDETAKIGNENSKTLTDYDYKHPPSASPPRNPLNLSIMTSPAPQIQVQMYNGSDDDTKELKQHQLCETADGYAILTDISAGKASQAASSIIPEYGGHYSMSQPVTNDLEDYRSRLVSQKVGNHCQSTPASPTYLNEAILKPWRSETAHSIPQKSLASTSSSTEFMMLKYLSSNNEVSSDYLHCQTSSSGSGLNSQPDSWFNNSSLNSCGSSVSYSNRSSLNNIKYNNNSRSLSSLYAQLHSSKLNNEYKRLQAPRQGHVSCSTSELDNRKPSYSSDKNSLPVHSSIDRSLFLSSSEVNGKFRRKKNYFEKLISMVPMVKSMSKVNLEASPKDFGKTEIYNPDILTQDLQIFHEISKSQDSQKSNHWLEEGSSIHQEASKNFDHSSLSPDRREEAFVCRICEKTIAIDELEFHSKLCSSLNELENLREKCDAKTKTMFDIITKIGSAKINYKIQAQAKSSIYLDYRDKRTIDKLTKYINRLSSEDFSTTLEKGVYDDLEDYFRYKLYLSKFYQEKIKPLFKQINMMNGPKINEDPWGSSSINSLNSAKSKSDTESSIPSELQFMSRMSKKSKFVHVFTGLLKLGKINRSYEHNDRLSSTESLIRAPNISEFKILKLLSKGGYGSVYLTRKRATGDIFAMKILKKEDMIIKNMVNHVTTEKKVMELVDSPFNVKLFYAFQSSKYLYLVMEYVPGGDLATLLYVKGQFEESMALFYAAEIILAMEVLHKGGMIHRDIKPGNILVGADGHIKLTDFGLSKIDTMGDKSRSNSNIATSKKFLKKTNGIGLFKKYYGNTKKISKKDRLSQQLNTRRKSFAQMRHRSKIDVSNDIEQKVLGTPDYLAPELVKGVEHNVAVDYWALGVCIYEFIFGFPPFNDESPELIFKNILSCNTIEFFNECDESSSSDDLIAPETSLTTRQLITQLLAKEPENRPSAPAIKKHDAFKNFNFMDWNKNIPPFTPNLEDETDTSYFLVVSGEHSIENDVISENTIQEAESKNSNCVSGDLNNKTNINLKNEVEKKTYRDAFSQFEYKNIQSLDAKNKTEIGNRAAQ